MKNSSMIISIPVITVLIWSLVSSLIPADMATTITTLFFNSVGYVIAALLVVCPAIALLGFALRD